MRLTIQLLGHTLDLSLEATTAEDTADEYVDAGTTGHYPISFVSAHDMPDEAAIHHQCSPYEDDSEARA